MAIELPCPAERLDGLKRIAGPIVMMIIALLPIKNTDCKQKSWNEFRSLVITT